MKEEWRKAVMCIFNAQLFLLIVSVVIFLAVGWSTATAIFGKLSLSIAGLVVVLLASLAGLGLLIWFFVCLNSFKNLQYDASDRNAVSSVFYGYLISAVSGFVLQFVNVAVCQGQFLFLPVIAGIVGIICLILIMLGFGNLKDSHRLNPTGRSAVTLLWIATICTLVMTGLCFFLFFLPAFLFVVLLLSIAIIVLNLIGWYRLADGIDDEPYNNYHSADYTYNPNEY